MRLFVAVRIPEPLLQRVIAVQEEFRQTGADVRWVSPASVHLTLAFLGEIDETRADSFKALLESEASKCSPLDIEYAGAGSFPPRGLPKVVWIGCRGDVTKLTDLASACRKAAEQVGVPPDRHSFVAHLTIGRVNSGRNAKRLVSAVKQQDEVEVGRDRVMEIRLMESTLMPEGPRYEVRETIALGKRS